MSDFIWGLLGPEKMTRVRRIRSLGLVGSVREFNDLAVPGMGGAWFGKQLMLATLGVALAEEARGAGRRVQNIEMANAVEALGCSFALDSSKAIDARVRGSTKLRGKTDRSFALVRKPGFYVTQPMRMGTVQGLPALGLVEAGGIRFNAFNCTKAGHDLLDASLARDSLFKGLMRWIAGEPEVPGGRALADALSPLKPLPSGARDILVERLRQGHVAEDPQNRSRRNAVLGWVESVRASGKSWSDWAQRPAGIMEDHWFDLRAGSLLFEMRDAALEALDMVELHINTLHAPRFLLKDELPEPIRLQLQALRGHAQAFNAHGHQDLEAQKFVSDCERGDAELLARMVMRDGRVLRRVGDAIVPGPAFQRSVMAATVTQADVAPAGAGQPVGAGEQQQVEGAGITWPPGISGRVHNLFLFNADMRGELDRWVATNPDDVNEEVAA